jgi:hypothetical protein
MEESRMDGNENKDLLDLHPLSSVIETEYGN